MAGITRQYRQRSMKAMIFDLAEDFAAALDAVPQDHPKRRTLRLLEEAIRRDIHFIDRHPTTFFQCMWNTCWWYDCSEAAAHYEAPEGDWAEPPPWERQGPSLSSLLSRWHSGKERAVPAVRWLRSLRPPAYPLGLGNRAVFDGRTPLTGVAFGTRGHEVIAGAADGTVRIWNIHSGIERLAWQAHDCQVLDIAYAGRQGRIAAAAADGTVTLWDAVTCDLFARLEGHTGPVTRVAFSADGRLLASVSQDGTVRVWCAETGRQNLVLLGHTNWVNGVSFSPDGTFLASCSADRTMRLWSATDGKVMAETRGHSECVFSVAVTHDARRVVTGAKDSTVRVWNASTGAETTVLQGHEGPVTCVACSPDDSLIVSGSTDRTVRVWDVIGKQEHACFRGHEAIIESVAVSPDNRLAVSTSGDGTARLWDLETIPSRRRLFGHREGTGSSEPGRLVVAIGAKTRSYSRLENRLTCLAYSPDGMLIASGDEDGRVWVWHARFGRPLMIFSEHAGNHERVQSLAFSLGKGLIASGGGMPSVAHSMLSSVKPAIFVWDPLTGKQRARLDGHSNPILGLCFSPNAARLASFESRPEAIAILVWDIGTGRLLYTAPCPIKAPGSLAFSADSTRITFTSHNPDVTRRTWDAATGTLLEQQPIPTDERRVDPAGQHDTLPRHGGDSAHGRLHEEGYPFPVTFERMAESRTCRTFAGITNHPPYEYVFLLAREGDVVEGVDLAATRKIAPRATPPAPRAPRHTAPQPPAPRFNDEVLPETSVRNEHSPESPRASPAPTVASEEEMHSKPWGSCEVSGRIWTTTCNRCGKFVGGEFPSERPYEADKVCPHCGYDGT